MYIILRVYDDCSSATERAEQITGALSAAAIYLEDPSCVSVKIWRAANPNEIILDYYREENDK